jgi:hypothetical protein
MECGKLFWLLACSASPQCSLSHIFLSFERIYTSTSSGHPHELVSFAANMTNLMHILGFIHAHCNQSVVNCFSLVAHIMHLVSLNFNIQIFKHLTWPIVSVNFNITMLHFVLFHNVTSYTNSLSSYIHVNNIKLHNIICILVTKGVILQSLDRSECRKLMKVIFI